MPFSLFKKTPSLQNIKKTRSAEIREAESSLQTSFEEVELLRVCFGLCFLQMIMLHYLVAIVHCLLQLLFSVEIIYKVFKLCFQVLEFFF